MRRSRGFSLVEVLMALAILTIVIMTTLAVFTERARRIQLATETVLAWQALANEAEVVRHTSFNGIQQTDPLAEFSSDTTILRPLRPFTTKIEVAQPRATMKEVTLTITWKQGKRTASLVVVRTNTGGTNLW
jgi:prepilin-type N-terminal cleavage/methylation domain-containing protein